MQQFKFSEEQAKKAIRSQMVVRAPLMLFAVLAGLFIANWQSDGEIFGDSVVLLISCLVIAIAVIIGLFVGLKFGPKMLMQNSYALTDTGIERHTALGQTTKIDFDSVNTTKVIKKGLLLKAKNRKLLIPSGLDNFNELKSLIENKLN